MTLAEARDWVEFFAIILGIIGAFVSFWSFQTTRQRERREAEEKQSAMHKQELRLDEVVKWGQRCIATTRLLYHILERQNHSGSPSEMDSPQELVEVAATLSALIDEGRLYFRNTIPVEGPYKGWGSHRKPAFQGIRPRILDPLVACYDAIPALKENNNPKQVLKAYRLAEEDYVSLLRHEVGRENSHSPSASAPGQGSTLTLYLMESRRRA